MTEHVWDSWITGWCELWTKGLSMSTNSIPDWTFTRASFGILPPFPLLNPCQHMKKNSLWTVNRHGENEPGLPSPCATAPPEQVLPSTVLLRQSCWFLGLVTTVTGLKKSKHTRLYFLQCTRMIMSSAEVPPTLAQRQNWVWKEVWLCWYSDVLN